MTRDILIATATLKKISQWFLYDTLNAIVDRGWRMIRLLGGTNHVLWLSVAFAFVLLTAEASKDPVRVRYFLRLRLSQSQSSQQAGCYQNLIMAYGR